MLIETKLQDFYQAHYRLSTPSDAIWEAADEWVKTVHRSIAAEIIENADWMLEEGNNSIYYLYVDPFTVLNPATVPNTWEDETVDVSAYGPHGDEVAYSFSTYAEEFDLGEDPFTVCGVWTDDGGASGLFGFKAAEPRKLIVLFC